VAKIGKKNLGFTRERDIDPSSKPIDDNARLSGSPEQETADAAAADRFLASAKNIKVLELADALAEESGNTTFIQVPVPGSLNYTPAASAAHEALKRKYNDVSKGGAFIYWDLFKQIIDNTLEEKAGSVEELFSPLSEEEFTDALDEIDTGALAALLQNPTTKVEDFVNYDPNKPKDPTKSLLLQLGAVAISVGLLSQLEKVRKKDSAREDTEAEEKAHQDRIESQNDEFQKFLKAFQGLTPKRPTPTGVAEVDRAATADYEAEVLKHNQARAELVRIHEEGLAKLGFKKASRLKIVLFRIAKAVALLALIHGITREEAVGQWKEQIAPNVDDDLAEEFQEQMLDLYDNPDEEMKKLLEDDPENNPDRVIIEYAFEYMEKHNGRGEHNNFTPWIVYASAAIKDIQMNDLDNSLSDTTNFEPITVERQSEQNILQTLARGPGTSNLRREGINTTVRIPDFETSAYVPEKVQDFFSKLPGGGKDKTFSVNVMDYIDLTSEVSDASSETSNYFMKLLQNGKYTPELVCCLINFLLKKQDVDINEAKEFLKSIRAVLTPVQFNYGRMFEDLVNRLFGDLKSKLLSYALSQLSKFFEKIKGKLNEWLLKIDDEEHYLIFCTPLLDIMASVTQAINQLQDTLETFLQELADYMLSFELKLEEGVVSLYSANRNRMLADLIESLLLALETGKLCKYNARQPSDIHPDALGIIDKNSAKPNKLLSEKINEFDRLLEKVEDLTGSESVVGYFTDPQDPAFSGGVSIHRSDEGLSAIDAIVKYASDCNSMKDSDSQANILISDLG
jgi:hypothetical protein